MNEQIHKHINKYLSEHHVSWQLNAVDLPHRLLAALVGALDEHRVEADALAQRRAAVRVAHL